jgi:hypothetical protein
MAREFAYLGKYDATLDSLYSLSHRSPLSFVPVYEVTIQLHKIVSRDRACESESPDLAL